MAETATDTLRRNPLTKQQQHIRSCVACAVTHGIANDIPASMADTEAGRKAKALLPIIDTVTKNLRNPAMTDKAWKRIRAVYSVVAKSLAYDATWEDGLQESVWTAQVFCAELLWQDARLLCPIWLQYPKEIAFGTRLVKGVLAEISEELLDRFGEEGPAELGGDVYCEICDILARKL